MAVALFFLSLILGASAVSNPTVPGATVVPSFKLRITRAGLDYANDVASETLNQQIRSLRIGNIEENGTRVTNIRVTNFGAPHYSYSLSPPSNISWGLDGADIELAATIYGCRQVLVKVCRSLDIVSGANAVSVRVTAQFGRHATSRDRPAVTRVDCRATIDRLELRVRGGLLGWLLNLFRSRVARKLKPKIEKALCDQAKKFLLERVNSKLASFPAEANVSQFFTLDYAMTSDLDVTAGHMEAALKGQIRPRNSTRIASPYGAIPMASRMHGHDRMMYAWASEKIINDLLYFTHMSNRTQLLVTDRTPVIGRHLKLICENATTKCLGSRLPELSDMFPSEVEAAELFLTTTSPPFVEITDGRATLSVNGTADLYVVLPSAATGGGGGSNTSARHHHHHSVALSAIDLTAHLWIGVENMRLIGQVNITDLNVRVLESKLDFFTVALLEATLSSTLPRQIGKAVNARFKTGLPIPVTKGISLIDPRIVLLDRTVQLETDVRYVRSLEETTTSSSPPE